MTGIKTSIKKLFQGEDSIDLLSDDIDVLKVELNKDSKVLSVSLKDSYHITDNDKILINELFKNKFPNLFISCSFLILDDILSDEELQEVVLQLIKNHIPSSSSWLEDVVFDEARDSYKLVLPHNIAYQSVTRNGLVDKLQGLIQKERNKALVIDYSDYNISEEFLYEKEIEERKILKDILSNSPRQNKDSKTKSKVSNKVYSYGKTIKNSLININDISIQTGSAAIQGTIFQVETKSINNKKTLCIFYLSDGTDSISAKVFLDSELTEEFIDNIKVNTHVQLEGDVVFDNYAKELTIMIKSLIVKEKPIRKDNAQDKRVELHLHTHMSSMDGITSTEELIKRAVKWGHKAIAITDHGVVQAFPEAMRFNKDIKIIYGVEAYMINDKKDVVTGYIEGRDLDDFVVFDLETTGLSAKNDKITEIGAVKIVKGEVVDRFSQLVDPQVPIPALITKLTGINDEMVKGQPVIDQVINSFNNFIGDSILVAHNASFDMGFIRENMKKIGIHISNPVLDTLELSRAVFPELKSHKLNLVAKHLKVELLNHHRAVDDSEATAMILLKTLDILRDKGVNTLAGLNTLGSGDISKGDMHHTIILAKNQHGLKDLYKLISESHLKYFHRKPRLPKSLIEEYRENLLIGSACEAGELYRAILANKTNNEINDIVSFYDYLEIQPLGNNLHLVRDGIVKDENELQEINKKIFSLGRQHNKLVVGTGDVHFLDEEDEIYRRILMSGQNYSDADFQPPLYLRTTDEMLKEFSYFDFETAKEIVIYNPGKISDLIDNCIPIPNGTFPPEIEGADDELRSITYRKAYEKYGNPLPEIVKSRLDRELDSIIKNGYAVMYIIAQKLVWKSVEDGYLVGSRGSVGSSFAATMSGITEVNPLPPHYSCPKCAKSEFFTDGSVASGFDLPDKVCPDCNEKYIKDGQDIPFEVFLGFEGDKEPDIDLNFAGEYQSRAHKYTEELFGEGKVFRAGTIGTIADKTAYGFVKKYFESKEINVSSAEINRLLKGCTGIKRTSGQHPGGVMIVPEYKDILDFTPIQYPADDKGSGVITTHFDYHSISGRILKLDILGHDVPSIIRMLEDITGVDPLSIPLDDKPTMDIFTTTESLKIKPEDINSPVGTMGIPEFGTKFVRQMLIETKPKTFSELVRISGLSHGTDVWINNAQLLVKNEIAPLSKVISTREDIMLSLINAGMEKKRSFFIMENVRKGKGLSPDDEQAMRDLDLPEWYIESCNKIKYMFPKAHAAAYVTMSFRIAYFKVHHPEAFYATYFTTKATDFDADLILKGSASIKDRIGEVDAKGNSASAKEKNQVTVLEVALEMLARGYKFKKVDLYKSDSDRFIITDQGILPPLKALEGVGENAARKIVEEREVSEFISIEDLIKRGKATRPVIDALENHGCLDKLPQSNQISLFNIWFCSFSML